MCPAVGRERDPVRRLACFVAPPACIRMIEPDGVVAAQGEQTVYAVFARRCFPGRPGRPTNGADLDDPALRDIDDAGPADSGADLALARPREGAQLCDHHDDAKRTMRGDPQPDASGLRARSVADLAGRGTRRRASQKPCSRPRSDRDRHL